MTVELQTGAKMKRQLAQGILMAVIAALFLMISPIAGQNISDAERQYREALHKQQVEGDLNGAVKMYQSLIDAKTTDRVVKAKALRQLAIAYEALGKESDALSSYEQIVKGFSDQPAVEEARRKIAEQRQSATPVMTLRKIEPGASVQNVIATDGKRAIYWDSTNTKLLAGDVGGKEKREIYRTNRRPTLFVSRDLAMLFFFFPAFQQEPPSYAIMKSDGTGFRDFVLVERGQKLTATTPACVTWSWDNTKLLMCKGGRPDRLTHLLKVSVADGTVQDLLEDQKTGVGQAEFSRDGRFIAYGSSFPAPVFVIPSTGGKPQLISEEGWLTGWSSDGSRLLIAEFRDGPRLSIVPMQNGQAAGKPTFVSSSIPVADLRVLSNDTLVLRSGGQPTLKVSIAALDGQDRLGSWKPLEFVDPAPGLSMLWSPDGRQIAYIAASGVIRLINVSTGEDREIYRANISSMLLTCLWGRQHSTLYCGRVVDTKTEIVAISLETGRAEKVGTLDGRRILRRLSPDDRKMYSVDTQGFAGHAWEIGTDQEVRDIVAQYESSDGEWTASIRTDSQNRRQLNIRPRLGDNEDWKELATVRIEGTRLNQLQMTFTSDAKWIVYHDKDADGKDSLYRVSTAGGEPPQRLGDYPSSGLNSNFTVSPDGRQFTVTTQGPPRQLEFWVAENVIPGTKPTPKPTAK
jgi:Tol biopolymer transport system component